MELRSEFNFQIRQGTKNIATYSGFQKKLIIIFGCDVPWGSINWRKTKITAKFYRKN
jgi:hypothetical protein